MKTIASGGAGSVKFRDKGPRIQGFEGSSAEVFCFNYFISALNILCSVYLGVTLQSMNPAVITSEKSRSTLLR